MSIFIKTISTALLIISTGNTFAQAGSQSSSNTKLVVIYRYDPDRKKDHKVKAIALLAAKCYYFKKLPHTQIGKPLSAENGKYISDVPITKFMSNLITKNFESINKKECNCGGVSDDTFVVEISPDGQSGSKKIFYVPKVANCPANSPCAVVDTITSIFLKLKQK